MEKYFVYLLLVSLAGYTRGRPGPYLRTTTCYNCVEILSGQLDPKYKTPICDGNYSRFHSKTQYPPVQNCFTINKTITSNAPNKDDKATILDMFMGVVGTCNQWKEAVSSYVRELGGVLNRCSECNEPRCNYPLPKATDADMIECYDCTDKDEISPCDEKNISESKTTKKDGRTYSCYTITTYYNGNKVKNSDRFPYEKDFCQELIKDLKYMEKMPDCKECTESRCNTDGYVPTTNLAIGLNQTPYFLLLYLISFLLIFPF